MGDRVVTCLSCMQPVGLDESGRRPISAYLQTDEGAVLSCLGRVWSMAWY